MSEQHTTTVHGLRPLIERAIKEYAEMFKSPFESNRLVAHPVLNDHARGLADHISKTIIGESFELELVRKMRPMVREHGALMRLIGYVAKDFQFMEDDDHNYDVLQGLREPPPKDETLLPKKE
jgi:hypothetical protein